MRDMSDGNNERKKRRGVYKIYYNIENREIEGDENRSEMGEIEQRIVYCWT